MNLRGFSSLFKLISISIFMLVLNACVKEEFLKVCYDNVQSGCVSLNNSTSNTPLKSASFTTSSATYLENIGGVAISVVLSEAHDLDVEIPFTISGTADFDSYKDFEITGLNVVFSPTTGQGILTIPAGFVSQSIIYNIIDDTKSENSEISYITLGTPTNAILGTVSVFQLNITDNDIASVIQFATTTSSAVEGNVVGTINVVLDKVTGKDILVNVARTGTAAYGADHSLNILAFTIPAESDSYSINFNLLSDTIQESDETIILNMTGATGGTLGVDITHTMTVQDNDNPPYIYYTNVFSVKSESTGAQSISVELSEASEKTITVDYTISGSSTAGDDHDAVNGTLTFNPTETSKNITFNLVDDAFAELDETVIITLSNPVFAQLSPSFTYTMMITDNEASPVISFEKPFSAFYEKNYQNQVYIKVVTDKISQANITVPYTISILSTAVAGVHHDLIDGNLVIPAGELAAAITFNIDPNIDTLNGESKTVVLNLGTPTGGVLGNVVAHTLQILDPIAIHIPNDIDLYFDNEYLFKYLISNKFNRVQLFEYLHPEDGFISMLTMNTQTGFSYTLDQGDNFKNFGSSAGITDSNAKNSYYDVLSKSLYVVGASGLYISNNMKAFNHLTTNEGIHTNSLKAVVADGLKIMVASDTALSYSTNGGVTWTLISSISGIPFTMINGLRYDQTTKVISILTNAGFVQTADWGTNFINKLTTSTYLPSNNVLDFVFKGGVGYILTDQGLVFGSVTNPSGFTSKNTVDIGIISSKLKNIDVDQSGIIYVCGKESISISSDSVATSFALKTVVSGITFSNNVNLKIDFEDKVYIATENAGLLKSEDALATMTKIEAGFSFENTKISSIDVDTNDRVVIGTEYGLYRCFDVDCIILEKNTSIYNGKINDVFVRKPDDRIFTATDGGFSHSDDFYTTVLTNVADPATALHDNNISTVFSIYGNGSTSDQYYFGTKASGLFKSMNNAATRTATPLLPNNNIKSYHYDSIHNRHYIGYSNSHIFTYTDDNYTSIVNDATLVGAISVNKIKTVDNNTDLGHLYIATNNGLYMSNNYYSDTVGANCGGAPNLMPDGYCTFYSATNGMTSSTVNTVEVIDIGGSHVILAGGDQGLSISLDMGGNFQSFDNTSGLPSSNVTAIRAASNGKVFIGTDKGLAVIRTNY